MCALGGQPRPSSCGGTTPVCVRAACPAFLRGLLPWRARQSRCPAQELPAAVAKAIDTVTVITEEAEAIGQVDTLQV